MYRSASSLSPLMVELVPVTCPSCFEMFEVAAPALSELPSDVDYDCEICCRPLRILFTDDDGEVVAEGRGLGE